MSNVKFGALGFLSGLGKGMALDHKANREDQSMARRQEALMLREQSLQNRKIQADIEAQGVDHTNRLEEIGAAGEERRQSDQGYIDGLIKRDAAKPARTTTSSGNESKLFQDAYFKALRILTQDYQIPPTPEMEAEAARMAKNSLSKGGLMNLGSPGGLTTDPEIIENKARELVNAGNDRAKEALIRTLSPRERREIVLRATEIEKEQPHVRPGGAMKMRKNRLEMSDWGL